MFWNRNSLVRKSKSNRIPPSHYVSWRKPVSLQILTDFCQITRCWQVTASLHKNVDMLEAKVGLSTDLSCAVNCNQLHGTIDQLRCTVCTKICACDGFEEGYNVLCPHRTIYSENRIKAGKRRAPTGILLPNIIRIGQEHTFGDRIAELPIWTRRHLIYSSYLAQA